MKLIFRNCYHNSFRNCYYNSFRNSYHNSFRNCYYNKVRNCFRNSCRNYLALVTIFLLTSCSQPITSVKQDVDINIEPEQGYLLIGLNIGQDLHKIVMGGESVIMLTYDDLKAGSQYILTPVPAGDYYIHKVILGNQGYIEMGEKEWSFRVAPQTISYVGDLYLKAHEHLEKTFIVELENRASVALSFVEQSYPNIRANHPMSYGGPGEDGFFEFLQRRGADHQLPQE